jgi:trigger factor
MLPIVVDEQPLLRFRIEDEQVLFSLALFDEENNPCVIIDDNELLFRATLYDVEFVGRRLIVRSHYRTILLDVTFEVPDRIVVNRARLNFNGVQFRVRNGELLLTNNNIRFYQVKWTNFIALFVIGPQLPFGMTFMTASADAVPRYFGGYMNRRSGILHSQAPPSGA